MQGLEKTFGENIEDIGKPGPSFKSVWCEDWVWDGSKKFESH